MFASYFIEQVEAIRREPLHSPPPSPSPTRVPTCFAFRGTEDELPGPNTTVSILHSIQLPFTSSKVRSAIHFLSIVPPIPSVSKHTVISPI